MFQNSCMLYVLQRAMPLQGFTIYFLIKLVSDHKDSVYEQYGTRTEDKRWRICMKKRNKSDPNKDRSL